MTKIYLKYSPLLFASNRYPTRGLDPNVDAMLDKNKPSDHRIRVIVENNNYLNPRVQLASLKEEYDQPWKQTYWFEDETTWNGEFTPDDTWQLFELEE